MCAMRWCYTAAKRATTVAAANRTCCALTLIRQLHTLDLPPLSNFDMHVRPTLAANMLTAALVGELSCCGRIWASCSGCLRKTCTATLALCHSWRHSRTWGHTTSLISERTDNEHSTNLDSNPMHPIRRLVREPLLLLASLPALGLLLCSRLSSYYHEA